MSFPHCLSTKPCLRNGPIDRSELLRVNREFKAYLHSKGVKATFIEVPGQGHVWPLWRQNLADFAPLLFR